MLVPAPGDARLQKRTSSSDVIEVDGRVAITGPRTCCAAFLTHLLGSCSKWESRGSSLAALSLGGITAASCGSDSAAAFRTPHISSVLSLPKADIALPSAGSPTRAQTVPSLSAAAFRTLNTESSERETISGSTNCVVSSIESSEAISPSNDAATTRLSSASSSCASINTSVSTCAPASSSLTHEVSSSKAAQAESVTCGEVMKLRAPPLFPSAKPSPTMSDRMAGSTTSITAR
mmetsp:Transcript_34547/g.86166  ORF Transcript_34547/g.86166 Transcript_34547/m.86166 type:complete len:234 (-) Transcript_34547:22-723(-)